MGLFTRALTAAILTAGCCLSMPAVDVLAQPLQTEPSTPAPDLSDQKLDAAAAAVKRVATLRKEYGQRLAEAEIPADKERIVAEGTHELTKAITEQGISVEEYVSILDAARDDREIRGKILQRIRPLDNGD